jgi:hypothetical protein
VCVTSSKNEPCSVGEWDIYVEENNSAQNSKCNCAYKLVFSKKIAREFIEK